MVAHRVELLDQMRAHVDALDRVVVTSVLKAKREDGPFDLVVIDEAHHAAARTYVAILESYPDARVMGLTATPARLDGKPLAVSDRLLLQVMSEERPTGWADEPAEAGSRRIRSLGRDPWRVREIAGTVEFRRADASKLRVRRLDHQGVPVADHGGVASEHATPRASMGAAELAQPQSPSRAGSGSTGSVSPFHEKPLSRLA
jgi:hypothetical protein